MRTSAKILLTAAAMSAAVLVLFEVNFDPVFALPRKVEVQDPATEMAFDACREKIRRDALAEAWGETDNPEVHSTMQRLAESEALRVCRERHPRKSKTVSKPFEFNLVDLRFRY